MLVDVYLIVLYLQIAFYTVGKLNYSNRLNSVSVVNYQLMIYLVVVYQLLLMIYLWMMIYLQMDLIYHFLLLI